MCNCLEEHSEKLKEKLPELILKKDSGFLEVESSYYKNSILAFFDSDSEVPFFIPYTVKYKRKLKNGTTKTKETTLSLLPTHCPYCGEKYDKK